MRGGKSWQGHWNIGLGSILVIQASKMNFGFVQFLKAVLQRLERRVSTLQFFEWRANRVLHFLNFGNFIVDILFLVISFLLEHLRVFDIWGKVMAKLFSSRLDLLFGSWDGGWLARGFPLRSFKIGLILFLSYLFWAVLDLLTHLEGYGRDLPLPVVLVKGEHIVDVLVSEHGPAGGSGTEFVLDLCGVGFRGNWGGIHRASSPCWDPCWDKRIIFLNHIYYYFNSQILL